MEQIINKRTFMKKVHTLFSLLASTIILLVSCYSKSGDDIEPPQLEPILSANGLVINNPNELQYLPSAPIPSLSSVSISNNPVAKSVESQIVITKSNTNFTFKTELNFASSAWKAIQKNQVELKINEIKQKNLNLSEIQAIINELEVLLQNSSDISSHEVLYSLTYNLSIFKTAKRSISDPSNSGCTIHPAFLVRKSYFVCQEDDIFNKVDLLNVLNNFENEFGPSLKIQQIRSFVNNNPSSSISFKDIYNIHYPIATFNLSLDNSINAPIPTATGDCSRCLLGCASAHGCCGNYSGCCYYWHEICYIHDKFCSFTKCRPRNICFSGCKPDPSGYIPEIVGGTTNPNPGTTTPTITIPGIGIDLFFQGESMDRITAIVRGNQPTFSTKIYRKNNLYYSDPNFTCLLPGGYYSSDRINVYQVQNGKAIEVKQLAPCSICPYPTLEPQQNPFIGCGSISPQPPTPTT